MLKHIGIRKSQRICRDNSMSPAVLTYAHMCTHTYAHACPFTSQSRFFLGQQYVFLASPSGEFLREKAYVCVCFLLSFFLSAQCPADGQVWMAQITHPGDHFCALVCGFRALGVPSSPWTCDACSGRRSTSGRDTPRRPPEDRRVSAGTCVF